jgi:phytoene dehydrogenase-like protein
MHDYWEEVGITRGREFINMDEYMHLEDSDGRILTFYTDVDRLEKHLVEFSPQDSGPIMEFISGIRMCLDFDQAPKNSPAITKAVKKMRMISGFIRNGKKMQQWMKTTCGEFAGRFKDPLLKKAFEEMWMPEFSIFFMLFTFAYMHRKNAGYPLGGSMPLSIALEERYKALGGTVHYKQRVEKILIDGNDTIGIRLENGSEHHCSRVISAADGYSTIFKMLDGKFTDENIHKTYDNWPLFPSLIFVGVGVNRTFKEIPLSVSGFSFALKEPAEIADSVVGRLWVHLYNHDT